MPLAMQVIAVLNREYIPRISDAELRERLEVRGAVLIEGPKWCGKTTTAERIARSVLYMQNPATRSQNIRLAEIKIRPGGKWAWINVKAQNKRGIL